PRRRPAARRRAAPSRPRRSLPHRRKPADPRRAEALRRKVALRAPALAAELEDGAEVVALLRRKHPLLRRRRRLPKKLQLRKAAARRPSLASAMRRFAKWPQRPRLRAAQQRQRLPHVAPEPVRKHAASSAVWSSR